MKKVRVSIFMDACQKERLEDLSRRTRVPMGDYIHEALEALLEKHEDSKAGAHGSAPLREEEPRHVEEPPPGGVSQ